MMRLCEPLNGIIYIYCTECRAAPLQTCRRANCWLTAPHCTALHCKSLVIIGIDCPRQDHFFADEVESTRGSPSTTTPHRAAQGAPRRTTTLLSNRVACWGKRTFTGVG